jgi:hypothetical protein
LTEFGSRSGLHKSGFVFGDAGRSHDLCGEDPHVIFTDRSETEFGLGRDTEFADEDDVEWGVKTGGDLSSHRHPATWQAEDHWGRTVRFG